MSLLEVKNVKKIYTTRFSNQQVQDVYKRQVLL